MDHSHLYSTVLSHAFFEIIQFFKIRDRHDNRVDLGIKACLDHCHFFFKSDVMVVLLELVIELLLEELLVLS